jgi:molybdate transport system regulatory protein
MVASSLFAFFLRQQCCKSGTTRYDGLMIDHPKISIRSRIRIYTGKEIALGPGKADLLHAIAKTGSIQKAATSLKMSYMRAWKLVRTMNDCFRQPLIEAVRGGKTKGGARLTPLGRKVLKAYLEMEKKSLNAVGPIYKKIKSALK